MNHKQIEESKIVFQTCVSAVAAGMAHLQQTGVLKIKAYLTPEQRAQEYAGTEEFFMTPEHLQISIMEAGKKVWDVIQQMSPYAQPQAPTPLTEPTGDDQG